MPDSVSFDPLPEDKLELWEGKRLGKYDRLIAAQALIEGVTVITRDRAIAAFGCEGPWQECGSAERLSP